MYDHDDGIWTLQIDKEFDLFRCYGINALSFNDQSKWNPDIIIKIFHLFLVLIFRPIDLSNWKLHDSAGIELVDLFCFRLVDSEKIGQTIKTLLHLIEKFIVEDQILV